MFHFSAEKIVLFSSFFAQKKPESFKQFLGSSKISLIFRSCSFVEGFMNVEMMREEFRQLLARLEFQINCSLVMEIRTVSQSSKLEFFLCHFLSSVWKRSL